MQALALLVFLDLSLQTSTWPLSQSLHLIVRQSVPTGHRAPGLNSTSLRLHKLQQLEALPLIRALFSPPMTSFHLHVNLTKQAARSCTGLLGQDRFQRRATVIQTEPPNCIHSSNLPSDPRDYRLFKEWGGGISAQQENSLRPKLLTCLTLPETSDRM
jgi:hypothetical protein